MSDMELRFGKYQDVLKDVSCNALITDPPYSERTHKGQRHGRKDPKYSNTTTNPILSNRGLEYEPWAEKDISEFINFWHPRVFGWMCIMMSHDLVPIYEYHLIKLGRYVFAPIPCIQKYRNVRLAGDGPCNWTDYLLVARKKVKMRCGSLPGVYIGPSHDPGENALDRAKRPVAGGKPLWLMRAIIRDYSSVGDIICDPCAGGANTLIGAEIEGRVSIGSEEKQTIFNKAIKVMGNGVTKDMFAVAT